MTCPKCHATMSRKSYNGVQAAQCGECQGIFLDRADLGSLVEAENDWHDHRSSYTRPLPRITADMKAPPQRAPRARSFVEGLFTA